MQTHNLWRLLWLVSAIVGLVFSTTLLTVAQDRRSLTPLQLEIEKQRARLNSTDLEERRDAITRLGSMKQPEASRAALAGLQDRMAIVRAVSTVAVLSLPPEESAVSLSPLLADKDPFVRREAAYALGTTRSRTGMNTLVNLLLTDKVDEVRGAAAVALGQISDASAVSALASVLNPQLSMPVSKKGKKIKREQNPFVLRSAARALGQIGSSAGVPALIAALQDAKAESDVRREAAFALGFIGDPAALGALNSALTDGDPYLVNTAHEAIRKIQRPK